MHKKRYRPYPHKARRGIPRTALHKKRYLRIGPLSAPGRIPWFSRANSPAQCPSRDLHNFRYLRLER
ncbi:hypothetical protein PUN4_280020 [Paraburkholderia unamae]|nr:hypothetical protein PUN4_280020 [Paraburkholderia unamae]